MNLNKKINIIISEQQYKRLSHLLENPTRSRVIYEDEYGSIEETDLIANDLLNEAEYKGHKVKLGKPFYTPDGPKKSSVYVENGSGKVIKVNFGDPNMRIKKSNPKNRKSFRARHKCDTANDRTSPKFWSCRAW